jgi:hypothetical protein
MFATLVPGSPFGDAVGSTPDLYPVMNQQVEDLFYPESYDHTVLSRLRGQYRYGTMKWYPEPLVKMVSLTPQFALKIDCCWRRLHLPSPCLP